MYSAKDKKETGKFVGFLLLKKHSWNKRSFIKAMSKRWGIVLDEKDDGGGGSDILLSDNDDFFLTLMFLDSPVAEEETEHFAEEDYMRRYCVKDISRHTSQIIVSAHSKKNDIKAGAELFVKAVDSVFGQSGAVGFSYGGVVYRKEHFRQGASVLREGGFPIDVLIRFGYYSDEARYGFYTVGMYRFGKREIEVYAEKEKNVSDNELIDFTADTAKYMILEDAEFESGETIGFDENDRHFVRITQGIALESETVKILY